MAHEKVFLDITVIADFASDGLCPAAFPNMPAFQICPAFCAKFLSVPAILNHFKNAVCRFVSRNAVKARIITGGRRADLPVASQPHAAFKHGFLEA